MEYRCEDLPQFGVVLLPPSSPEYLELLAGIEMRLANTLPGAPPQFQRADNSSAPAMILCNQSQGPIAAVSWIWKFEPETGRPMSHSIAIASGTSLLSPFGLDERSKKVYGYWHLILPGSKRIIRGSSMLGNNTDVRPPAPDELWKGGGLGFGGGSRSPQGPLKAITLVLDGVFFADGGFAGPDTLHNFDRITASVAAHLQVGNMARDGHYQGRTPAEIFRQIEAITGPDRGPAVPPPPRSAGRGYNDDRQDSLRDLAWRIAGMRHSIPDEERALDRLMSWANADIPKFRKL